MSKSKTDTKQDKRAAALRENLRKRKLMAKEKKGRPPHTDQKTPEEKDDE